MYVPYSGAGVPATALHFDIADLLADALAQNAIQPSWWLASVETADILYQGTGSTTLTNYKVQYQSR